MDGADYLWPVSWATQLMLAARIMHLRKSSSPQVVMPHTTRSFMCPDMRLVRGNALNAAQCEVEKIRTLASEPTLLRHTAILNGIADRLAAEIATIRRGDIE